MKVLITGGGGYIGSVLTQILLERGYKVKVLDRFFFGIETLKNVLKNKNLEIVKDDIRWCKEDVLKGVDAVIDMAALSNDPSGELNPQKTWEINHKGRVRIANLAKKQGVKRYIFPSSCSVYGFQNEIVDERSSTNPLTTYAKANLEAEKDILTLKDDNFTVVILRQATVYGYSPRMRFDLAINGMVLGFYKNKKIPILRDGTQWRPFVHIKDTSHAMILALEADKHLINGEIFNVGSNEQNYQIFSLAKMVAEAMGIPFEYEWYGLPDHRSYKVNFDKIAKVLGFKPEYTPKDGAVEVYEALKNGKVSPDDPKTITVKWYKQLLEMQRILKEIEINGVIL